MDYNPYYHYLFVANIATEFAISNSFSVGSNVFFFYFIFIFY